MSGLPLLGSTDPWSGGPYSALLSCVLAPNPSPMTLDGTNTWVVGQCVVIDPGPDIVEHLAAIFAAADGGVTQILLTHGHPDHILGGEGLGAGDVVAVGDVEVQVVATPGHTADCLSFHVPADGVILTGDTVLGRGTTVVAWPDGHLADYLASLESLRERAATTGAVALLPGHGPVLRDPVAVITGYLDHRRARLEQVRSAWEAGLRTPDEIVDAVYEEIPEQVRWAALLSTRAQIEYLEALP